MKKIIYFLVAIFIFLSCKDFKEAQCTGVTGFKINKVDMNGIDADIMLGIKNPNSIGFSIYPSEFDVKLAGIGLGKAKLKKRVHIDANTEKDYTFNLKSSFKDMNMMDVMKLVNSGGSGMIQVKGDLKAGKFYLKKKFPVNEKRSLR
ncbi:MAG: LEA type 2 family protein [Bacteroidia bacterium]|jgi:LEA14-like dessication related protein|nr:LEA type 2 family protein [Sphingobacteriaceae bacterium]MBK7310987.1 LEA type 2 family protein [Sphingobacteriaceae bacterium]MBP9069669.1 LEA type 2 family protein [Bacteroidia bacterium]